MMFIAAALLFGTTLAQIAESNIQKHVAALSLSANFNPVKESYWTGLPHHRRTPFAVSPNGKSAYLAFLDASQTDVHVQQVDPSTFGAVGTPVTVTGGKEAGGLVAHDDGFALLTNEAMPSGTTNAPPSNTPVAVIYRYRAGKQLWKKYLGGPDNVGDMGALASPDMNGDLVYSAAAGMYGAYFVVTAYSGSAQGHFGDSIQYVNDNGTLEHIQGASSSWGCSHNTGIAFEAADSVPFASLCAEDQGAIWLNTGDTGMDKSGVKVSNENVQNGASNEPMGGMSGSYSSMARFINSDSYIFTWVSRGAKDLTTNEWMGSGYTKSVNRTVNRNVAIATFSNKKTLVGQQATSALGSDGDKQINWITTGTADAQNAHVATFDKTSALVTWEEIAKPTCEFIAMGCKGTYTGSFFQLVQDGKKVGTPAKLMDVYVAGDMVTMADGRICFPYVNMKWTLDGPVPSPASVKAISFACVSLGVTPSAVPVSTSTPASFSTASLSSQFVHSLTSVTSVYVDNSAPSSALPPAAESSVPAVVTNIVSNIDTVVASQSGIAEVTSKAESTPKESPVTPTVPNTTPHTKQPAQTSLAVEGSQVPVVTSLVAFPTRSFTTMFSRNSTRTTGSQLAPSGRPGRHSKHTHSEHRRHGETARPTFLI